MAEKDDKKEEKKDHPEEGGEIKPEGGKPKIPKKFIIIGGGILAVIIIGVVLLLVLGGGGDEAAEEGGHGGEPAKHDAKDAGKGGDKAKPASGGGAHGGGGGEAETVLEEMSAQYVDIGSLTVNLSDPTGKKHLLIHIKLEVEGANEPLKKEVESKLPAIKDTIIFILTSKTSDEVRDQAGKLFLKETIKSRVNSLLKLGELTGVHFENFILD